MNIDELSPLIDDLALHIQDNMGIKSMPAITMQDDPKNADVLLGKTAQYDPQNKVITVFVSKRHPKDIMRSIAHEFIHHAQNERGDFDNLGAVGEGYAQSDEHLRKMEKEAYLKGNMCFRDWEDGYKRQMMESIHRQNSFKRRNDIMKKYNTEKNNELNKLLMEKFNFGGKKKEYDLEEGADRIFAPNHYCAHHVVYEGEEAYTVDHNWDEELQEVTEYDIRFRDGTVKRNVSINELEVLEAFSEAHHGNRDKKKGEKEHPPVKSAKKKDKEKDEEVNEGSYGNRDQDKKEDKGDDEPEQLYRYDKDGKIVPVTKAYMAGKNVRKFFGLDEEKDNTLEEGEETCPDCKKPKKDCICPDKKKKETNEGIGKRSQELGADDNPEETKMDHLPDEVLKNIAKKKGKKDKKEDEKEKQEESFRNSVRKLMEEILELE